MVLFSAGRFMTREAASEKFNWNVANPFLRQQGVTLVSAGLDEVSMEYKTRTPTKAWPPRATRSESWANLIPSS